MHKWTLGAWLFERCFFCEITNVFICMSDCLDSEVLGAVFGDRGIIAAVGHRDIIIDVNHGNGQLQVMI